MKELTYEEVYKEWGNSRYKRVNYKGKQLPIRLVPRRPLRVPFGEETQRRAFYVGTFNYTRKGESGKRTSFESIHYDKVFSRFQKFVDEYCTEWQARADVPYKGYTIKIDQEKDKDFYIGYVQFHKNSTFKHIAYTREEIERCCKNRIDQVLYHRGVLLDIYKGYELEISFEPTIHYPYLGKKPYVGRVRELLLSWRGETPEDIKKEFREYFDEKGMSRKMLTPKQEKIQELEQLQARISAQLEELKKEKDTWVYKGIVLEYGTDEKLDEGYFVGRIKNASEGTQEFYGRLESVIKSDLENYIDELEKSANLYRKLTGKEE